MFLVETYGTDEVKFCYIEESTYEVAPANPTLYAVPFEGIDPGIDPGNIQFRGGGSHDLQSIKKGLRQIGCKIGWIIPSLYPTTFLQ